jgi:hypothetical protein
VVGSQIACKIVAIERKFIGNKKPSYFKNISTHLGIVVIRIGLCGKCLTAEVGPRKNEVLSNKELTMLPTRTGKRSYLHMKLVRTPLLITLSELQLILENDLLEISPLLRSW